MFIQPGCGSIASPSAAPALARPAGCIKASRPGRHAWRISRPPRLAGDEHLVSPHAAVHHCPAGWRGHGAAALKCGTLSSSSPGLKLCGCVLRSRRVSQTRSAGCFNLVAGIQPPLATHRPTSCSLPYTCTVMAGCSKNGARAYSAAAAPGAVACCASRPALCTIALSRHQIPSRFMCLHSCCLHPSSLPHPPEQCQCAGTPAAVPRGRRCSTRRRPPSDRHPAQWPAAGDLQGAAGGGLCWHCRQLSRTSGAPLDGAASHQHQQCRRMGPKGLPSTPRLLPTAATSRPVLRRTAFMRTLSSPSCPSLTLKLQQWAAGAQNIGVKACSLGQGQAADWCRQPAAELCGSNTCSAPTAAGSMARHTGNTHGAATSSH